MKILLVGGNGFIGSRLFTALVNHHYEVTVASRYPKPDQIRLSPWEKLNINPCEFDLVINAAGKYGVIKDKNEIFSTIEANIGVAQSIGRSIHLVNRGFINLSSYFELLSQESITGQSYYVKSKSLGNNISQFWSDLNLINYSRIILFDNFDEDLTRHKLLDQLIQASIKNSSMMIKNINNTLNLLHLNSITNAILNVVQSHNTSTPLTGIVEIKNEISYSISDLIYKIEQFSGKKLSILNKDEVVDAEVQKVISQKNGFQINIKEDIDTYLRKMVGKRQ